MVTPDAQPPDTSAGADRADDKLADDKLIDDRPTDEEIFDAQATGPRSPFEIAARKARVSLVVAVISLFGLAIPLGPVGLLLALDARRAALEADNGPAERVSTWAQITSVISIVAAAIFVALWLIARDGDPAAETG